MIHSSVVKSPDKAILLNKINITPRDSLEIPWGLIYCSGLFDVMAAKPTSDIPTITKANPNIWCLNNFLFKKKTDIREVVIIKPPLKV